jgi:hypothetical protein
LLGKYAFGFAKGALRIIFAQDLESLSVFLSKYMLMLLAGVFSALGQLCSGQAKGD